MPLHDVIQANRKDLQRFLGLNDDNEMVKSKDDKTLNLTKYFPPRSTFAMCANHRSRTLTTGGGGPNQVQFCTARC